MDLSRSSRQCVSYIRNIFTLHIMIYVRLIYVHFVHIVYVHIVHVHFLNVQIVYEHIVNVDLIYVHIVYVHIIRKVFTYHKQSILHIRYLYADILYSYSNDCNSG